MTDNFINSEGKIIKTSSMSDEHSIIKINEKTPILTNIGKIVAGDTNSNILQFEMNRYYDGVDLLNKDIRFIVSNSNGVFIEKAVNLLYNDELIRFSWVLSYAVTYKSGNVNAAIQFLGEENGLNYSLKTTAFTIKVDNSIDATDITLTVPENWFVNFEERLSSLENKNEEFKNDITESLNYETEDIDFSSFASDDSL